MSRPELRPTRQPLSDAFVRPGSIEVVYIRLDHSIQLPLAEDQQVIQALPAHTAEIPLDNRIRPRRLDRRP